MRFILPDDEMALFSIPMCRVCSSSANPSDVLNQLETPLVYRPLDGWTLLHFFADAGCSEKLMTALIDAGVPIDDENMHETPLFLATRNGFLDLCKLLVLRGARVDTKYISYTRLVTFAVENGNTELVLWVLKQDGENRLKWNSNTLYLILNNAPKAAIPYLDKFAINHGPAHGGGSNIEYFDLRRVYGDPKESIDSSALAIAVRFVAKKNVLSHPIMKHVVDVKWREYRRMISKELNIYSILLISYFWTAIMQSPYWSDLTRMQDQVAVVLRILAWVSCLYLVVFVEYREFRGGSYQYLRYLSNWLNLATYGVILISIPFDFTSDPTSSERINFLAVTIALLGINLLQYVRVVDEEVGILVMIMGRMIRDVSQIFVLFIIFPAAFGVALHLLLDDADGYETVGRSFTTLLLMVLGTLDYGPSKNATDMKWMLSNLLLFVYIILVVIMILNMLIAMMSSSFTAITKSAEEKSILRRAEDVLRIERSLSMKVRLSQFEKLLPAMTEQEAAKSPGSMDQRFNELNTVDTRNSSEERQPTNGKIHPEETKEDAENAQHQPTASKVKLAPLEDGVRRQKSVEPPPNETSILSIFETRLDSLEFNLKAEMKELKAEVAGLKIINLEMATQMRELLVLVGDIRTQTRNTLSLDIQVPSSTAVATNSGSNQDTTQIQRDALTRRSTHLNRLNDQESAIQALMELEDMPDD